MASHKKILKSKNGISITEVRLMGNGGPFSIAYSVSKTHPPETVTAENLVEAERIYNEWLS